MTERTKKDKDHHWGSHGKDRETKIEKDAGKIWNIKRRLY